MAAPTLVLIRHTPCAVEPGICYGRLDLPLAASGTRDIHDILARIPPLATVFTSPAQRCRALAHAVAARDHCAVHVLDDLKELDFGDWEGRAWSTIDRAESDFWAADPWTRAPPNGETEAQLWQRVRRVAQQLRALTCHRAGVISHGGPLRLLRCELLDLTLSERWSVNPVLGSVECIPCDFA